MKTHPREILIYYNSESSSDRKTLAYAESTGFKVRSYCHNNSPSTTTSWKTILESLNKHPKEIMNKAHPYYQANIKGRDFDMDDWVQIIKKNPQILKSPIAMKGQKAVICTTPSDIYRL
jgi:arsenate reductase (glutaredoxin)